MQLSLIAWIENNDQNSKQPEQLSLLSWIDGELIAILVERKLFQRDQSETKQCLTCLEVHPVDSLYCDEMGWPVCVSCK